MKKVINPNFPDDVSEYIEAAGWDRIDGKGEILFTRNGQHDTMVAIKGDVFEVLIYNDGEPGQRKSRLEPDFSFYGIGQLNFFKWAELLDITGVVPLKKVVNAMSQEKALHPLFQQILSHFGVTDNHNALPVNY